MDTTSQKFFRLSKPDYLKEAHGRHKGFPLFVELIKFVILFKGTMWLVPLLVGKLLGAVIGFGMFTVCVLAALALGGAKFEGFNQGTLGMVLLMLPFVLFQSLGEEVMFRGYFLTNSTVKCPLWPAAILNGLLFAIGHQSNAGAASFFPVLNLTLVGILLTVLTLRRGNIWAACTLHGLWNYTQGFVYGLPISGQESGGTLLQFSLVDGKPLVTGGVFGVEGSLLTTVVEVLAIVLILFLTRDRAADDDV